MASFSSPCQSPVSADSTSLMTSPRPTYDARDDTLPTPPASSPPDEVNEEGRVVFPPSPSLAEGAQWCLMHGSTELNAGDGIGSGIIETTGYHTRRSEVSEQNKPSWKTAGVVTKRNRSTVERLDNTEMTQGTGEKTPFLFHTQICTRHPGVEARPPSRKDTADTRTSSPTSIEVASAAVQPLELNLLRRTTTSSPCSSSPLAELALWGQPNASATGSLAEPETARSKGNSGDENISIDEKAVVEVRDPFPSEATQLRRLMPSAGASNPTANANGHEVCVRSFPIISSSSCLNAGHLTADAATTTQGSSSREVSAPMQDGFQAVNTCIEESLPQDALNRRRFHEAALTETHDSQNHRLQLQLQRVTEDNRELRQRLDELLRIHEELERRCRQQAAVKISVGNQVCQRETHAPGKTDQNRARHAEPGDETYQGATLQPQQNEHESLQEVETLRKMLTEVQKELRDSMVQQLELKMQLGCVKEVHSAAEKKQAGLMIAAEQVRATEHERADTSRMEHLRRLRAAEERVAITEQVFGHLCTTIVSFEEAAANRQVSAEATAVDRASPDTESLAEGERGCTSPTSTQLIPPAKESPGAEDEAEIVRTVEAVMRHYELGSQEPAEALLTFSLTPTPRGASEVEPSTASANPSVAISKERYDLEERRSSPIASLSGMTSAHLSNAGRLYYRRRLSEMKSALMRFSEAFHVAVDRAVGSFEMEVSARNVALVTELKKLRARLAETQNKPQPLLDRTKDVGTQVCVADPSPLRRTYGGATLGRVSVGVNTVTPEGLQTLSSPESGEAALPSCMVAQLNRERHYHRNFIAQLEEEVRELRASFQGVSKLEKISKALRDVRVDIRRLVRDAVDDMSGIALKRPTLSTISSGSVREEGRASLSTENRSPGQPRCEIGDGDTAPPCVAMYSTPPQAGATVSWTTSTPQLNRFIPQLLDFRFLRAIQAAALRAEAAVHLFSSALLRSRSQDENHGALHKTSPCTSKEILTNGTMAVEIRRGSTTAGLTHADTALSSSPRDAAPTIPKDLEAAHKVPHRTEKEDEVYTDMQGLLGRYKARSDTASQLEGLTSTSPSPNPRCSSEVSHFKIAKGSPPRLKMRPSSTSASPHAVVGRLTSAAMSDRLSLSPPNPSAHRSERETYRVASLGSAPLQEGLTRLTATAQELRNVSQILQNLRDMEDAHEVRQRRCLQEWQERIVRTVDQVFRTVESELQAVRTRCVLVEDESLQYGTLPRGTAAPSGPGKAFRDGALPDARDEACPSLPLASRSSAATSQPPRTVLEAAIAGSVWATPKNSMTGAIVYR